MNDMIGEPRVVPAGNGAAWWGEGWRLFRASMGTWIGIMLIYLAISFGLGLIPYVGSVGHWLLTPVFMGGLMIGCAALRRGEPLRVAHLFEGFQGAHFVPLMIIGAVNIAITLAIVALAGVSVLATMRLADLANMSDPLNAFLGSARAITGTSLLATLVILVIGAAFAMLNWFAPALVALRGTSAVEAMKLSFVSCLRNWVPFLIYGLIGIAIAVVAGIAFIGLAVALGAGAFMSATTAGSIGAMLGFFFIAMATMAVVALVVGPVIFGTTYAGYEDTLAAGDESLVNPAYQ
ncbi:MAG: BPSS1780 family membrane protein [Burkholderiales bacterium]